MKRAHIERILELQAKLREINQEIRKLDDQENALINERNELQSPIAFGLSPSRMRRIVKVGAAYYELKYLDAAHAEVFPVEVVEADDTPDEEPQPLPDEEEAAPAPPRGPRGSQAPEPPPVAAHGRGRP